jgi:ribonuclease HI
MILAERNSVELLWVPGHKGTGGNEIADQLAERGLQHPVMEPEPACGISDTVVGQIIGDCMCREH